jgi:RNA polymerase sigma-70 factor (ECF subfamily)
VQAAAFVLAPLFADGTILRRVQRPAGPDPALEIERAWVARAKAGDHAALRAILEKHGPVLYRAVLLPRLGDEARARDALADTYAKVVVSIARYEWHPAGIWPWLRTIAFHVAIDQLRARKRETPFGPEDLEREIDREGATGAGDLAYAEREEAARARARIEEALAAIHPRYAQAIRMRVLEERPREEVAAALGATAATFDVVLHRAMAALRKALAASSSPDSDRAPAEPAARKRAKHG